VATNGKAEHWRSHAAEARAVAQEMTHEETRTVMLAVAAGYERLAKQAEKHAVATGEVEPDSSLPRDC
jgi:plasmid stability protein